MNAKTMSRVKSVRGVEVHMDAYNNYQMVSCPSTALSLHRCITTESSGDRIDHINALRLDPSDA